MNIITSDFELTTSLTNVVILIVSIYCYLKVKQKSWENFFMFVIIDSLIGSIAHGIVMSSITNNILWFALLIFFIITLISFAIIFVDQYQKEIIYISIIMMMILISQLLFDYNYVITFITYAIIIVIFTLYHIIKSKNKSKKWYILGILNILIGCPINYFKIEIGNINQNGIIHLIFAITLIILYIGIKKETIAKQ